MRTRACIVLAGAALVCLGLSGCVVVVKGGDEVQVSEHRADMAHLGVELSGVSAATAAQAGVDGARSCVITGVSAGSAAERAGIERYDIVSHIDGRDYATTNALREAVRSRRPGDTLSLTIVRAGTPRSVTATFERE